jgi:hypothetical protein
LYIRCLRENIGHIFNWLPCVQYFPINIAGVSF